MIYVATAIAQNTFKYGDMAFIDVEHTNECLVLVCDDYILKIDGESEGTQTV